MVAFIIQLYYKNYEKDDVSSCVRKNNIDILRLCNQNIQ